MRSAPLGCLVSDNVGHLESKNGHPLKDDSGPFMHACHCGNWGYFGFEVMLMKGRTGNSWFCAEHRPADEPGSSRWSILAARTWKRPPAARKLGQ